MIELEPRVDREQKAALQTLFNLDFYLAKQRSQMESEYERWMGHRSTLDYRQADAMQLHLDPLSMERTLDSERLQALRGRYLRHARGVQAMGLLVAQQTGQQRDLDNWLQVDERLPGTLQEKRSRQDQLSRSETPIDAYMQAVFAPECGVSNAKQTFTFSNLEVTTFGVSFEINRPLSAFPSDYDPRRWDKVAPESFAIADRIDPASERDALIPGTFLIPTRADSAQEDGEAGKSAEFPLFENAITTAGGDTSSPVTDFRNVLKIVYTVKPDLIDLKYSLSEAITFALDKRVARGGLDRDSGSATIEALPGNRVRISASKSIRVCSPDIVRDLMNSNMAAILPFWFYNLVVLGACKEPA